jgi:hypothetical protein
MKYIPCNESDQVYNWNITNKKGRYLNLDVDDPKFKSDGFKKLKQTRKKK